MERSPSNSRRIAAYDLPTTCVRTLSRPRCAMPIRTSCAPLRAASSTASSSIGTRTSSPSIENCFWPMNARRRYVSKRLDPSQALEEAPAVVVGESRSKATRLDRLPKPDALGVVGDVLDLVGDRARVDLLEVGSASRSVLVRARTDGAVGRECGSAAPASAAARDASRRAPGHPSAPSRVDPAGRSGGRASGTPSRADIAAATAPIRSSSGACRGAAVSGWAARRRSSPRGAGPRAIREALVGRRAAVSRRRRLSLELEGDGSTRAVAVPLEQLPPCRVDRLRVVEVLLEELLDVAGIETGRLEGRHRSGCSSRISRARCRSGQRRSSRARRQPRRPRLRPRRASGELWVIRTATSATMIAAVARRSRGTRDGDARECEGEGAEETRDAICAVRRGNGAHARARAVGRGRSGRIGRRRARVWRRCFQSSHPQGVSGDSTGASSPPSTARLGAKRPPEDDAEVDHRDLEDAEHEDRFPHGDVHGAIQSNRPGRRAGCRVTNTSLTLQPLGCPELQTLRPAASWETTRETYPSASSSFCPFVAGMRQPRPRSQQSECGSGSTTIRAFAGSPTGTSAWRERRS